ncbi:hypothetical protein BDV3_002950 [Batrachochytrium dendrobatidis]|uniref:tripeptidyl-peptidase II n=1 Tax=Batrachochytrium dendrobatidis (strain JEL423) TaxID=403673 RepID=A0A177WZ54_BATDL|nr:hypothetical protein BDEG_28513 [Batrachochytrium dendrobatidis JEL423]
MTDKTMSRSAFPVEGLLPKNETEAAMFISSNPEMDGRGTVIAILDTGVDPGAPGLQVTSHGLLKIIHLIDCTGAGDVPCSTVVEPTPNADVTTSSLGTIVGLSGRTLTLGNWNCPTNKFRLGLKHSSDLYPGPLVDRLEKSSKEKTLISHHALLTQTEALAVTADNSTATDDNAILTKNDQKARVEVLKDFMKNHEDPGILMDCVVFHDGKTWRAAIDVNETGDLTNVTTLASYSEEHQHLCFGDDSMLNYSVNIYDEGQMLSIVTLAGSHGTHVAAISAANYPEDSRLNGIAPGAQIVSLKIGDTRLGSMETGAGLVRAAIELARLNIDLANISYGEAAAIPDTGRFIELLRDEVINKKGCIVVASGGNAGPALTTVGAPGGTGSAVIGVGAYVSHSMMDAEYALLDKVEERAYTWSSRGPSSDGDIGVDIFAPGAAITSVPQYTIQRSQLMNGTSMSSPNCCGCLALLLSGLKAKQIPYTPYLIKAAIQATGKDIKDPFGIRFVQVQKAWNYLTDTAQGYLPSTLHYAITIPERDDARGIYLRDVVETSELQQLAVKVSPVFPRKDEPSQNLSKLSMEVQVLLKCSDRWISAPNFVLLNNSGRAFNIRVDPTQLRPGFHYGTITGYDANKPEVGSIFTIPITVCKPEVVTSALTETSCYVKYDSLSFKSGDIQRHFVHVPLGANFAELIMRSEGRQTSANFYVHMLQLHPQSRYPMYEKKYTFSLNSVGSGAMNEDSVYRKHFSVLPNVTIELCLAQFWSSLDPSTVSVELKFHGLLASASASTTGGNGLSSGSGGDLMYINPGSNGFARVDITAPVRNESISPSISLDTLRKSIRPTDFTISPLKSRDVLPDTRQLHQLVLTYSTKINESGSITPRFPRMNNMLYDSSLENFGLFVFDSNKRTIAFRDIYPKAIKALEGTYTFRAQVVSHSLDVLEKLQSMPLVLDIALSKSVSLSIYNSLAGAISEDAAMSYKRKTLLRGQRSVFWVGDIASNSVPKDAKHGDLLVGKLDLTSTKIDGDLYPVAYLVSPEIKKDASNDITLAGEKEPIKEDATLITEAVRDLEISWIKKLKSDEERKLLLSKLEKENPTHLPLFKQKLEQLTEKSTQFSSATPMSDELSSQILATTLQIINIIDEGSVAKYFGVQHDVAQGGEKMRTEKSEMEAKKELLIMAYRWKSAAYYSMLDTTKERAEQSTLFVEALAKYAEWLPSSSAADGYYILLSACRNRLRGHHGLALKSLNKFIADRKNVSTEEAGKNLWKAAIELRVSILNELGWNMWADYESKWKSLKFPTEYASF